MTISQAPVATFLLGELRRARTGKGLSQEDLGKAINYSASLVSAVENGQQKPTSDFLTRVDEVLETGGIFTRMMTDLVSLESALPWLRPWIMVEREATVLRIFEPIYVPGLFQTEEYARAIFECGGILSDEDIEKRFATRVERQSVLLSEHPPQIVAVMDESVLRRAVGGPKVMCDQLLQLARIGADNRRVRLHIVPATAGEYPGLNGPFVTATLPDDEDVVYLDSQVQGQENDRAADVMWVRRVWEATLGETLTPQQSIELIAEVAETWT